LNIRHPFIEAVQFLSSSEAVVILSKEFPIRSFKVLSAPKIWEDYEEVMAEIVFVHDTGEIDRITGTDFTFEGAVVSAITNFVNLIVHPEGLTCENFAMASDHPTTD